MLDEAKRRELETQYKRIEVVNTSQGVAVFKRLDRRQRNQYLTLVSQQKLGEGADFATLATVVMPDRTTFDSWLDEEPGIAIQCMGKLTDFNKLGALEEGK